MAVNSKSCPSNARRPAPLFTVLVDFETLNGRICELENGTVVPPGSLLPWLDGADVERAVFSPGGKVAIGCTSGSPPGSTAGSPEPIWSGPCSAPGAGWRPVPPTGSSTGATRRAIEVRDRECTHPFCEVRAPFCQVDHIQPWALGGPTTQENGRLLCPPHNGQRNQRPPPAAT